MGQPTFAAEDLATEPLPPRGFYRSRIMRARLCYSLSGNRMLQIVHELDGVANRHARVAEYFVLEGASPQGLGLARRRLVELYRACGLEPQAGHEIKPAELEGAELEVKVTHEEWQGEGRLSVTAHRCCEGGNGDGVPF